MKRILLAGILPCIHIALFAQFSDFCTSDRFGDELVFSAADIVTEYNIAYGLADNWYQNDVNYKLNTFDIAYPDPAIDPVQKRPLVVLFHGGGFVGGDKGGLDLFIQSLAQRGYVAASCNYRLGWQTGGVEPGDCMGDPASLLDAWYRCSQDVDAAMRFLVSQATEYGIDTSWVFAGGQSAGVMGVNTVLFVPQNVLDQQYPLQSDKFGPIHGADNPIPANYSVKGVINMWGAILDTSYLTSTKNIPFISFYGDADRVIPPNSGPVQGCTDPNQYFTVFGSAAISKRLEHLNICSLVHENIMGAHEAYEDAFTIPNTACFIKSILCDACISDRYQNEQGSCRDAYTSNTDILSGDLTLFPNPSDQYVHITLPTGGDGGTVIVYIYDAAGNMLFTEQRTADSMVSIRTADLPNGMYIMQVRTQLRTFTAKCIIAHL